MKEAVYRTPKLSGGAPFFNMCLCLQTKERCSCFIYIVERTMWKKYLFPCLSQTVRPLSGFTMIFNSRSHRLLIDVKINTDVDSMDAFNSFFMMLGKGRTI